METWAEFRIHSRLKMPGSSEKDRPLADPCISRPPPRCYDHDPDPLRSLSAAYFPEILKGMYRVLSDEIGEPRGCHSYRKELEKKVAALPFTAATESVEPPLDLTN
jgi:hypothetical protein